MNYLPSPAIRIGSARDALGVMNTVVRCVIHCPFDLFVSQVRRRRVPLPAWMDSTNQFARFVPRGCPSILPHLTFNAKQLGSSLLLKFIIFCLEIRYVIVKARTIHESWGEGPETDGSLSRFGSSPADWQCNAVTWTNHIVITRRRTSEPRSRVPIGTVVRAGC